MLPILAVLQYFILRGAVVLAVFQGFMLRGAAGTSIARNNFLESCSISGFDTVGTL